MADEKRSVLIVTVSDSVSAGTREDRSGALAAAALWIYPSTKAFMGLVA